jgi:DNA-binding response OmpR family regulator
MPNTVLIVTGCKEWGSSLARYFEKREFRVTGCPDYREAERIAGSQRFDIAIIDYFIGAADGGALCDALARQQGWDTALIIVSGKQSAFIERAIRRHSPAYYFVKPCSFENLLAVMLRICCERAKKELQKHAQRQTPVKAAPVMREKTRRARGKGRVPPAAGKGPLKIRAGKRVSGTTPAGERS